jgi:DNA-binding PadR family transcriptional regulator
MARRLSRQAIETLVALREEGGWLHGYELSRRTGLKPGTLYPILERLALRGLLEGRWEPSPLNKRPARHAYRLTDAGGRMLSEELRHVPAAALHARTREALA